jgi:hypothetical protein
MKKVEFYPSSRLSQLTVSPPKPASQYMPDWYKQTKVFGGDKPRFENGSITNTTVKACMPFFDAYNSGYIQETWTDIKFSFDSENKSFEYHCATSPDIIGHRMTPSVELSDIFRPHEFTWQFHWMPKLEKGYSMLITQPFNRFDLPFMNTTGIIDSDDFFNTSPGSYPFYIYKNFEGIIPKGTPMYQMIPIKRDSWESSSQKFNEEEHIKRISLSRSLFFGSYKKLFHKKKVYR